MNLQSLLKNTKKDQILFKINQMFNFVDNNKMSIVLDQLYNLEATASVYKIAIEYDMPFAKDIYSINGIYPEIPNERYSISYSKWNEWLGMEISEDTIKQFDEITILAFCIFEMTIFGYSQEDLDNNITELLRNDL